MIRNKFLAIEQYGKEYIEHILLQPCGSLPTDKNIYLNESYGALKFFFSKSFYRGRKDELSLRFQERAIKALDDYYSSGIIYEINERDLEKSLCDKYVNNFKDRQMVTDVIKFALKKKMCNIVTYAIDEIKKGKAENIYMELIDLRQIGPKLASLFLRDIVLLYDLKKFLTMDTEKYFQPVDTWVRQVAEKLEIIGKQDKDIIRISEKIVIQCHNYNVCPLLFNAGAWYVGAKSFELLLERLGY